MVKLTESIIFGRTKCNNIECVKKLNVWGCDIHDISIVAQMPNLEVLSLSVNQVECLEPLANCYNLKELYMRKNEVSDLDQVDFLKKLHKLKVLWLDDNPIADDPEYRVRVLRALPHLQTFDNRTVNQEEVAYAVSTQAPFQNPMTSSQISLSGSYAQQQQQQQYNPIMSNSQLSNVMTSSMMSRSATSIPDDMASSVSYHHQQMGYGGPSDPMSHSAGVQIIEGHSTPTPMCEVAIYNPSLPPASMSQSYHQQYTQQTVPHLTQIPDHHGMDESWHEFVDEEPVSALPSIPRFGMRKTASPRNRMTRSRSASPGRRMDSIISAISVLMDELDQESLKTVIDEAYERIKKQR